MQQGVDALCTALLDNSGDNMSENNLALVHCTFSLEKDDDSQNISVCRVEMGGKGDHNGRAEVQDT